VRRQANCHHAPKAAPANFSYCFGDERMPVSHSDEDRHPQTAGQGLGLSLRMPQQGRATNELVASLHFFDHRRWQRAPAADVQQKLGHVLNLLRRAVRQQQHGPAFSLIGGHVHGLAVSSCTHSTTARTFSTGVPGRMP
jgi:hypothetical protein